MGFIVVLILIAIIPVALAFTIQLFLCSHSKKLVFKLIPLVLPVLLFFAGISVYRPVSPYGCGIGQLLWIVLLGDICVSMLLGFGLGWLTDWWRREE